MELTNEQIERQDFVDNLTFEFLNKLIPNDEQIDWDIESISTIRNTVCKVLVDKGICTEQEFYPYMED